MSRNTPIPFRSRRKKIDLSEIEKPTNTVETIINDAPPGEPIPKAVIDNFIYALREQLRGEKRDNNCLRWLLSGNNDVINIEKTKAYLPSPLAVGLLALQKILDKYYDIEETYNDQWDDIEPASEIDIEIGYDKKTTCYETGVLELTNKKTKNRLTLHLNGDVQRPFFKVYSYEGNGEAKLFLTRFQKTVRKQNLYKNQTFRLENTYSAGLLPIFIKSTAIKEEDVIIRKDIADLIIKNVLNIFERSQEYAKAKIPLKRGILFEGPPGNGKTTIVKYIETRLQGKVTFIYVTDGVIRSASDIGDIYSLARKFAPSVVVFEDIDTIGLSRERGNANFTSELLSQLDGLEELNGVVTIATTNHADLIDEALKNRPQRFDIRIEIPLPDENLRLGMWKNFLRDKEIDTTNINIEKLAKQSDKLSGVMIKEVVISAKMKMVDEQLEKVTEELLIQCIDALRKNYKDSQANSKYQESMGFRAR